MMHRMSFVPLGEFSLAAGVNFLEGFAPLAYHGTDDTVLRLAFAVDGDWRTVGVTVRQEADGTVQAEASGDADPVLLRAQVARILSLDVDGTTFIDVVRGDEVAAGLVDQRPGLRPFCFNSPWEAACWAVIGQRLRIVQAAVIRTRVSTALGQTVDVGGVRVAAFPDPETLLAAPGIPGVPDIKAERLRGLARAALAGELDAQRIRDEGPLASLSRLCGLPGIGPFSAELTVIRGAGEPDYFPWNERRLHASMGDLYGVDPNDTFALQRIADRWQPFRSWVCFLHRVNREALTGEIGGRPRRRTTAS
jgi:DNA-3-methyladenine glycosylase II